MVFWQRIALAGVCAGLLALDRRAFLQAMFSRPLVAAPLIGWVMGDVSSGLHIGMLLELYYLGSASLGAAVPDHDTLAAMGTAAAAAAMTHATQSGSTPAIWSLSILLFLILGKVGRSLDRLLERYSMGLAQGAVAAVDKGQLDDAMRRNLLALWPPFLVFGALTAACALLGLELGFALSQVPLNLLRGLAWAFPAMASVAAAVAARGSRARQAFAWAGSSAALVVSAATLWALWGER